MAITNVSPAYITQFDTLVKQAYQGTGKLRQSVRFVDGVEGSVYKFPVLDAGQATARGAAGSDLVAMGGTFGQKDCILSDWNATDYVDNWEKLKVNFSIEQEYVARCAKAIARREDQLVIAALNTAGAAGTTVPNNVSGSVAGLTVAAVRAAMSALDDVEADEDGRFFVFNSIAKAKLLSAVEVTSSDYANVKALVNGEVDTFLGFKFIMLGSRAEGGLPKTATTRSCFAYHKDSVGLAVAMDSPVRIEYVAHKGSWIVDKQYSAGAVVIDPKGVVKVQCEEA